MTIVAEAAELPPRHGQLAAMALGALGVVYGDIGTSPLYTFKTAIEWAGGEASPMAALGMLSLIVWTLIISRVTSSPPFCSAHSCWLPPVDGAESG
jgi:KUP system potassium uptake protein